MTKEEIRKGYAEWLKERIESNTPTDFTDRSMWCQGAMWMERKYRKKLVEKQREIDVLRIALDREVESEFV